MRLKSSAYSGPSHAVVLMVALCGLLVSSACSITEQTSGSCREELIEFTSALTTAIAGELDRLGIQDAGQVGVPEWPGVAEDASFATGDSAIGVLACLSRATGEAGMVEFTRCIEVRTITVWPTLVQTRFVTVWLVKTEMGWLLASPGQLQGVRVDATTTEHLLRIHRDVKVPNLSLSVPGE